MKRSRRREATAAGRDRSAHILAEATSIFGTRRKAVEWLNTPIRALGGGTPQAHLQSELGAARVQDVLTAVDHGVYV